MKTSVSSRLAERGAVVVDADAIVRELQAPGQAVLAAMVERFGEAILLPDGSLDRQAVADMVFNDDAARADHHVRLRAQPRGPAPGPRAC